MNKCERIIQGSLLVSMFPSFLFSMIWGEAGIMVCMLLWMVVVMGITTFLGVTLLEQEMLSRGRKKTT